MGILHAKHTNYRIPKKSAAKRRIRPIKSISKLVKEADKLFSLIVRHNQTKCYTCDHVGDKLQAGHYISRYYKITRWNRMNVKPQCFMCNIYRKGNAVMFRRHLVAEYGEQAIKDMESTISQDSRGIMDREILEKLIQSFTCELQMKS